MSVKKLTTLICTCAFSFMLVGCFQEVDRTPVENTGQQFRMRIAHGGSEAMLTHRTLEVFREEVIRNSNGQIEVAIFPSAQLGTDALVISSLQTGDIEMTVLNTAALVQFTDIMNIMAVPFMFPSREVALATLDSDFGQRVSGMLEEEMGVVGLGFWDSLDFRQLTSSRPIRGVEDLSGLRIRTMENPIQIAIWNSLGASPTPITFAELYTALQQGTVDAQENPLELITMMRFYEVQDYVTLTNHLFTTGQAIMSPHFYYSLPPDLQLVVREAVRTAIDWQREVFAADHERFVEILLDNNIEIIELSLEDLEALRNNAMPVIDSIRQQVGDDLMDHLFATVEELAGS